ncbi:MAG: pilus assembly protein PilC [Deltaproteobacteria bacterium]|nr:pilus assembly protein PilC [Deltaproteobacteria bacterium]MBU54503.1 pilus assembly protein PilC [Deltaproteobacteria bacterium]|tara:strand:+ start:7588 stop:8799 length:1212 start_codon:yes stop_codon:yes gene_type:complete
MPVFVWEGRNTAGELKKGEMEAKSEQDVQSRLRHMNINSPAIKKKGISIDIKMPELFAGVSIKELVLFTRQFATMIDAGLPLVQCLDILASQNGNPFFKRILFQIKSDVEGGATFADSLKKHPKVFDDLFVNLVAAGEIGGVLDTILNRLAIFIEKNMQVIKKVKGAMVYPLIILGVTIASVIVMLVWVIPTFEKMFKNMGGQLPAPTQFVIDLSKFFQSYILFILGGIALVIYGFRQFYASAWGRKIFDRVMLRAPIFGPVIRKSAVAKFTRTLGTMLSSGVPLLDALDIVARSAGNKTIEKAIYYVRDKISEGRNIAEPLMETKVFPPMVVQMIGVGEATGALDVMLTKIAEFYEDEVDDAVSAMTTMLEPLMLVVVATVLGGMLIAMYMPIFSLAGNVKT